MMQMGKYYNSEVHYFPSNDGFSFYYIYKIPYSQLFFEKDSNDNFTAGIIVNIELSDSISNLITRGFDEKTVSVNNFDLTTSKDLSLQGLININLKEGQYKLLVTISDKISQRERRLPPERIELSNNEKLLQPLILNQKKYSCKNIETFSISDNSSFIPFNKPDDILAIPVTDSTITSLRLSVNRRDTVLIKDEIEKLIVVAEPVLELCNNEVIIPSNKRNNNLRYFLFDNFSAKLSEGPISIRVVPDNDSSKKKIFFSDVVWIGKPRSLLNPETALNLLEIIEPEEKIDQLLKKDNYKVALDDYWQKLDPTPNTNYNELMNEFYQRVDYCQENFKSIDGSNGAYSDRGKIYIKLGPPDKIERNSSNEDKVVETWFYNKPKKKFVFVDNDGTGKYLLVSEQ
jgi:GWxTD domain-containing protein